MYYLTFIFEYYVIFLYFFICYFCYFLICEKIMGQPITQSTLLLASHLKDLFLT